MLQQNSQYRVSVWVFPMKLRSHDDLGDESEYCAHCHSNQANVNACRVIIGKKSKFLLCLLNLLLF